MGLLDSWDEFKAYVKANTPRSATPRVSPAKVINEGLLNPNQYNKPAADRFKDSAFGLLGVVPGLGDAAAIPEAADFWNRGDKLNAGLAGLGALPLIPSLAGHIVYHGSPHKFNKFDMSKIGTGEGAQAYGHGLYFAESRDVAQEYAKNLSIGGKFVSVNGKDIKPLNSSLKWTPEETAAANLIDAGGDFDKAIRRVSNQYEKPRKIISELEKLQKQGAILKDPGNLYKVDIPDEAIPRMLDWDKPLSEQPDLQKALGLGIRDRSKRFDPSYSVELNVPLKNGNTAIWPLDPFPSEQAAMEAFNKMTGAQLYSRMSRKSMPEGGASFLKDAGIPGIRYLDGMSRGAGQGSSNYVLFDDELARILEINGQPTGLLPWGKK